MGKMWTFQKAKKIFYLPLLELLYRAQTIHRENFLPNSIQVSALLNIKTGNCPENCSYCAQSAHYKTGLNKEPLLEIDQIIAAAKQAKELGSSRFCMAAAWRGPNDNDLETICSIIKAVKKVGLETCVSLGLLRDHQIEMLKDAGLDFYNHNIDTSPEFYGNIVTTHTFTDRLNTLNAVRKFGIKICSGGILGLGETNDDRINMLLFLATLDVQPESVPINKFIKIPGTPLEHSNSIESFDFIRTIALTRIMMPKSYIRLAAGREDMSDEFQTLCFMGGANSLFYGRKLLTAKNRLPEQDNLLFEKIGLKKCSNLLSNKKNMSSCTL